MLIYNIRKKMNKKNKIAITVTFLHNYKKQSLNQNIIFLNITKVT